MLRYAQLFKLPPYYFCIPGALNLVKSFLRAFESLEFSIGISGPTKKILKASNLKLCAAVRGLPRSLSNVGTLPEAKAMAPDIMTMQKPLSVHLRHISRYNSHKIADKGIIRKGSELSKGILYDYKMTLQQIFFALRHLHLTGSL